MGFLLKNDSDNCPHELWAQQQAASCAIASLWMARNQAKQSTSAEDEWALAWRMYNEVVQNVPGGLVPAAPAPQTFYPPAYQNNQSTFANQFSQAGTFMSQVISALRNDGLKVTFSTGFAKGTVVDASKLSDTTPAIILLGWYNGAVRNGGHFIVASRVTSRGRIVYLDPWGGELRELGAGPAYQGTGSFEQVTYISA